MRRGLVKALWNHEVDGYYMKTGHIESNLKAYTQLCGDSVVRP